ncbi:hypothetical protein OS493_034900 [Desmophyllum pertusum]|uniref:Nocturnin n=1 Tax=Desmophyllum pertusum TaxID=174260 RepID=A0A9X0CWV3_9CNID|nr:hypothetical protein OS493_034900 [Desmophyllum pertusum]
MMNELQWLDGDIVCLQEVDTPYFTEILKEDMSFLGYKGMFAQKSQCTGRKVGVALFFKQDKFELEESKTLVINEIAAGVFTEVESNKFGEVLILAALRHKNSNTMLLTATTHILWKDLLEPVTQVCEIALVTQALRDMVTALRSQDKHVAYILCGDFNIDPHYPAYHLLKDGKLSEEQFCKLQTVDYLKFAADVEKPHQVLPEQISLLNKVKKHLHNPLTNMQSAYKVVMGSEPQCTSSEDDASRVWTIDYIWFDSENLKVTAALETLPESAIAAYRGFPNEYFSSDHFSLKAHFKFIVKP